MLASQQGAFSHLPDCNSSRDSRLLVHGKIQQVWDLQRQVEFLSVIRKDGVSTPTFAGAWMRWLWVISVRVHVRENKQFWVKSSIWEQQRFFHILILKHLNPDRPNNTFLLCFFLMFGVLLLSYCIFPDFLHGACSDIHHVVVLHWFVHL